MSKVIVKTSDFVGIRFALMNHETIAGNELLFRFDLKFAEHHWGKTIVRHCGVQSNGLGGSEIIRVTKDSEARVAGIPIILIGDRAMNVDPIRPGMIAV